jgi:PAS domain S-box-containing protein
MSKLTSLMKNWGKNANPNAAASPRRRSGVVNAAPKYSGAQAGEILKVFDKNYRTLFLQTTDAVMLIDTKTGVIVDANSACATMFGYSREKLTGMPYQQIQPDWKNNGNKNRFYEQLQAGTVLLDNLTGRGADGKEIKVSISSSIISLNNKPVIQNIFREMNERNSLLNKMTESEEKFSRAFHASPDAMSISDLTDGRFIEVNESYTRITGHTRLELINKNAEDFSMWATDEDRKKMLGPWQRHENLRNQEVDCRRKDGNIITMRISSEFIQISGRPCILVVSTDITAEKRTKKALEESGEQLTRIFRLSPQQIIVSRLHDGKILDVNEQFTRIYGYTREEIIGRTATEIKLWPKPEDRQRMLEMIKNNGRVYNELFTFQTKSGDILTELYSAEPIELNGEECLIAIITDITKRNRLENTLKESEEKFSKAFHAIPERITISRIRDGMILDVNDSFLRDRKRTREETIGRTVYEIKLWSDAQKRDDLIREIKKHGRIVNREMAYTTGEGTRETTLYSADIININGEPCLISITNEITQRKRIEQALKESEEKFSKTFQALPESISISRVKDGTFIEVNRSFCRQRGLVREEVLGHSAKELGLWEAPGERERMIREIQEKGLAAEREYTIELKNGKKQTSLISADIVEFSGEPNLIVISKDITERTRMEKALQESEEKFYKAFQAIPESIVISKVATGVFVDVNDNFCRITGLSRQEIIGKTSSEISIPERMENRADIIKTIMEKGRILNREVEYRMRNGQMRTTLYSADIIELEGEPCLISLSTDITERKQMEKALKDSEEKFYKAFRSIPESIAISRVSDGVILDVNDNFCRVAKRPYDEIIGHTDTELNFSLLPGNRERDIQIIKEQGGIKNREIIFNADTDKVRAILFSADIIDFGGVPCVISISTDITERKRLEKALQESEEKFSKAFHVIPESVSIARLSDGVLVDVNESFCRHNDLKREEIIGHTPVELGLLAQSGGGYKDYDAKYEQAHLDNVEFEFKLKNGEIHTVLVSADVFNIRGEPHVLSIGNDISDRKRMEVALRESEEKFSKAFHAIPESISIATVDKGIFLDVNDSFLHSNNLTREQVIGHSAMELKLWNNPKEHEEMVRLVKERGSVVNDERQFVLESGDKVTLLFSANIVQIAGRPCLISITNNITARKQMEEQLKKALAELQNSSARLKATNKELESFSYSISHDLRSPLRSIDGFSQALLEDYAPQLDETARDYLNRMRGASQKMGDLIDGLLKLSRLTRNEMHYESVDLSALALEITSRMQETEPGRKAVFDIKPGLKTAGDAQMLRVMMENLLSNAWKFTSKVPEAHIQFGSNIRGGEETFFIKDNGAGFDMTYRDKLFGAFQRLHNNADFPGTGIGLATVMRIINRHGGSIRAEGAVGQGATFYFTL